MALAVSGGGRSRDHRTVAQIATTALRQKVRLPPHPQFLMENLWVAFDLPSTAGQVTMAFYDFIRRENSQFRDFRWVLALGE